jgi:hypothetical protein
MQTEIEATFLDVNHELLRTKLVELGAACVEPKHDMRRTVYDFPDLRLDKKAAWVRVRQEAEKITMTFKHRQSETSEGMKEVELAVDNYASACAFLEAVGLAVKGLMLKLKARRRRAFVAYLKSLASTTIRPSLTVLMVCTKNISTLLAPKSVLYRSPLGQFQTGSKPSADSLYLIKLVLK